MSSRHRSRANSASWTRPASTRTSARLARLHSSRGKLIDSRFSMAFISSLACFSFNPCMFCRIAARQSATARRRAGSPAATQPTGALIRNHRIA